MPAQSNGRKKDAVAGQPSKSARVAAKPTPITRTTAARTPAAVRRKSVPTPTVLPPTSAVRLSATAHDIAKMSVSMPASIAKAVRAIAGRGQVSAYVTHALERQLALDRLAAYVDDVERSLGRPISDELMDEAAVAWHGE